MTCMCLQKVGTKQYFAKQFWIIGGGWGTGAGQGGRTGSPVSSTDDALARANGLPGLLPPQAQDSASSKNALPKSASTSHLGTLKQMPPGPMVRLIIGLASFEVSVLLHLRYTQALVTS